MASLLLKPAKNRIDKFIYSGLPGNRNLRMINRGVTQRRSLETTPAPPNGSSETRTQACQWNLDSPPRQLWKSGA